MEVCRLGGPSDSDHHGRPEKRPEWRSKKVVTRQIIADQILEIRGSHIPQRRLFDNTLFVRWRKALTSAPVVWNDKDLPPFPVYRVPNYLHVQSPCPVYASDSRLVMDAGGRPSL